METTVVNDQLIIDTLNKMKEGFIKEYSTMAIRSNLSESEKDSLACLKYLLQNWDDPVSREVIMDEMASSQKQLDGVGIGFTQLIAMGAKLLKNPKTQAAIAKAGGKVFKKVAAKRQEKKAAKAATKSAAAAASSSAVRYSSEAPTQQADNSEIKSKLLIPIVGGILALGIGGIIIWKNSQNATS